MYCSCPYALDGRNCKHMAAVLYEWSENEAEEKKDEENAINTDLFQPAYTVNSHKKKLTAVEGLVSGCLLYTSPSPRDRTSSRMPSSA